MDSNGKAGELNGRGLIAEDHAVLRRVLLA